MGDRSETEKKDLVFTWKIENILWNVQSNVLLSREFTARINEWDTKWCLRLHPERSREFILCHLKRVDGEMPKEVYVGFELSCIKADGNAESAFAKDHVQFVKDSYLGISTSKWSWSRMLEKRSLYFPQDSFTIRCQMRSSSLFEIHPVEYMAVTHFEVSRVLYQKDIHDLISLDSPVKCHPFPCDDFEIILCKKGDSECISAEFRRHANAMPRIRLHCKLSVRNHKDVSLCEIQDNCLFEANKNIWKFSDLIQVNGITINGENTGNVLKFLFDLKVHSGKVNSRINETKSAPTTSTALTNVFAYKSLSEEFEALYTEKRYTDVEIRLGKETFSAHKLVLRARSPVFAAMFDHDMVEKETSVVQVDDVEAATFDKLLSFMYSGVLKNMDEDFAMKLLPVADRYQILTLKKKCATFLINVVSVQNACLLLQLGDIHHVESLQTVAQEFICNHHRQIFSSDEWRLFSMNNAALATDIFQKLSIRYINV